MRVKRKKQARHLLSIYQKFFGFQEPYQIVIDGTFCKMSVQYGIDIRDQTSKYLQGNIHCLTTRCVLKELELLGEVMYPAKIVAQRFKLHHCAHQKKPVSAISCLKSILKEDNQDKLFLATQDFELTKAAATVPGVPLLYLHKNSIVLDKVSPATAKRVEDLSQGKANPSDDQQGKIAIMKKEANIESVQKQGTRKRKRPKGPNPLSCKKSKKTPQMMNMNVQANSEGGRRKKRKRRANEKKVVPK